MASKNIKGITIEIDGNTTKLTDALKDVEKQASDTTSRLKDIDRHLKFNPGNAELIGQKFRALGDKIDQTKDKLKTLKEADKQAKEQLERGELGQDEYEALRREIIKTEDQLRNLKKEYLNTENAMMRFGDKMKGAGEKMQNVGGAATKYVTAPIVGIGTAALAAFSDVDEAMDGIATATGATGEDLASLQNSFRELSTSTVHGMDDISVAIGELNTHYGLMGEELEAASEYALEFAAINDADVAGSIQSAKQVMEQFGLEVDSLPSVLDAVTASAQATGRSTDEIFNAMVRGAPVLKDLGLSAEESAMLVGQMQQSGIDASKGLNYLTKAAVTAAKDGKSLNEALSEFEELAKSNESETKKLEAAAELFGSKGGKMMLEAVQNGTMSFEDMATSLDGLDGLVSQTFEETKDPIDSWTTVLNSAKLMLADLAVPIQETLLPIFEKVIEKIKDWSEKWQSLSPGMQEAIVKFGLLAAAAGPVLSVLGKITSVGGGVVGALGKVGNAAKLVAGGGGFGGIASAAGGLIGKFGSLITAMGPWGLAAGAVVGAGVLIYKNWDTIKEKAGQLKDWVGEKWENIKEKTSETWNNVKETMSDTFGKAKDWVVEKATNIKDSVSEKWGNIKEKTSEVWGNVKTKVTDSMQTAWQNTKEKAGKLKDSYLESMKRIKEGNADVWDCVKMSPAGAIAEALKTAFPQLEKLKSAFSDAFGKIKGWAQDAWAGVKNFFGFGGEPNVPDVPAGGTTPGGGGNAGAGFVPMTYLSDTIDSLKLPRLLGGLEWFDRGGIFRRPAVVGVGEKRPEFVGALDDLRKIVREEVKDQPQPVTISGNNFYVREEADLDKVADALAAKIYKKKRSFA